MVNKRESLTSSFLFLGAVVLGAVGNLTKWFDKWYTNVGCWGRFRFLFVGFESCVGVVFLLLLAFL